MGSPIVDPVQRDAFLRAASEMGFDRESFGFVFGSMVEAAEDGPAVIVHRVHISRLGNWRSYRHGNGLQWVEQAREDLSAGAFRAPFFVEGVYKAKRNGKRYEYELDCWPFRGTLQWDARVRCDGMPPYRTNGVVLTFTGPPSDELLRSMVESSIEGRVGVD